MTTGGVQHLGTMQTDATESIIPIGMGGLQVCALMVGSHHFCLGPEELRRAVRDCIKVMQSSRLSLQLYNWSIVDRETLEASYVGRNRRVHGTDTMFIVGERCTFLDQGWSAVSYIQRQVERMNCEELCQLVLRYYRRVLQWSCPCAGASFKVLDPEALAAMLYRVDGYDRLMAGFTAIDVIVLYSGEWTKRLQMFLDDEVEDCPALDTTDVIRAV